MIRWLFIIAAVVAIALSNVAANAQSLPIGGGGGGGASEAATVSVPEDLTPAEVRDLLSRLSDQQVRDLLLKRLDALAKEDQAQAASEPSTVEKVAKIAKGFANTLVSTVLGFPKMVAAQVSAAENFYASHQSGGVFRFFGIIVLAIVGGFVGVALIMLVTRPWRARLRKQAEDDSLVSTLKILGARLLLDLSGIIAFLVVSRIVLVQTAAAADLNISWTIVLMLVALPYATVSILRFALAPKHPDWRLVHTDDWTARFLYRNLVALTAIVGFQVAVLLFNQENGVDIVEARVGFWLSAVIFLYLAWIAYRARRGLTLMLQGDGEEVTRLEARVARVYPYAIVVAVGLTWLLVQLLVSQNMTQLLVHGEAYQTLGLFILAPALDTLVRGLVNHLVPPMRGEGTVAERAYKSTKRSYIHIGRVLVYGLFLYLLAVIWEIDYHNMASAGLGAQFAGHLISALVILGIGYLVYEVVSLWINRKLASEQTAMAGDAHAEDAGEVLGQGGSRLSTVLPMIRFFLQVAIVVLTVLIALGNIGIDVTPLLAGAGIFGLAIGFGAQKLVTDVVSGLFFLIDDAFRKGEFIEVSGTVGTVERISIRSLQLRHQEGPVHTIPFGEIPKITNFSRDWVIVKMKFTVPFETDLNKVRKIFKQIGQEMMEVPEFAQDFMQPFKSQGVYQVDDVGIVVRGKFMSKPGKQFVLRREVYQRVQRAFQANGIDFARREVRVHVESDGGDLSEEEKQQVAKAAAAAASATEQPKPA